MTDREINLEIALDRGWIVNATQTAELLFMGYAPGGIELEPIPNFCVDLNAIDAACRNKFKERIQRDLYCYELVQLVGITATAEDRHTDEFDELHPTCRQRAEAYVRTIGTWME